MEVVPLPVIITFICKDNLFFILENWNIYANVGLRLIDQVQRQNLNKVYEHNVVGEALELAYGGEYAVGQTGAMQYWTKANHLTTSLYSDYSFHSTNINSK